MLLRRPIAIATIALAATGVSAAPAFAKAPSKHAPHAARAEKAQKRSFVIVGTIVSVASDSVTITVKGGNQRTLKGKDQTVLVPDGASIRRDGTEVALSVLTPTDHVMVKGAIKVGEALTASKVRAEAAEAAETTEAPKTPETPETESHPAS